MFDKMRSFITKIAKIFHEIANWAIVLSMVIVVLNIILRKIFKLPILGTYEYVGFLSSMIVAFGLAYCLVVNSHIAIDFIVEKFNKKHVRWIDLTTYSISLFFMSFFTIRMFMYAGNLVSHGEVSPTTQFPFYIFVYFLAISLTVLCLVLISKITDSIRGVAIR